MTQILKQLKTGLKKISSEKVSQEILNGMQTAEIDGYSVSMRTLDRDGEDHVLLHVQDASERWCRAGVRLIHGADGRTELQSSFGIDQMPYALERDFPAQQDATDILAGLLSSYAPSSDHASELQDQLGQCFARIRNRWRENAKLGCSVERFSIYKTYQLCLVLAAPATEMGAHELVGVEDRGSEQGFKRIWSSETSLKKLKQVTQKTISELTQLSGHEKLQLLAGERTPLLETAMAAFEEERKRLEYRSGYLSLGYPSSGAVAYLDKIADDGWSGGVWLENGDRASVVASESQPTYYNGAPREQYMLLTSRLSEKNLKTEVGWNTEKAVFSIHGGFGSKTRFPSIADLHLSLRTLFERIIILDPVWPRWLEEKFNDDFDPAHPALGGLTVPPRHQKMVATLLYQGYERVAKLTERFVQKNIKLAEKIDKAADSQKELIDGAVFGDVKTGRLKFFEKAKINQNARIFMVQTVGVPGAKRRRRALVPLWGADNSRPLTPKHIARMPNYTKPDALLLFPEQFLGLERRDLHEAAFRVSFTLEAGAENPFLSGEESIVEMETDDPLITLRITRVDETIGYELAAFSVLDMTPADFYGAPRSTGAGLAFLTTPEGSQCYLRPSFLSQKSHLPERERAWLEAAIVRAFPFDQEKAETIRKHLETEWAALRKTYPCE